VANGKEKRRPAIKKSKARTAGKKRRGGDINQRICGAGEKPGVEGITQKKRRRKQRKTNEPERKKKGPATDKSAKGEARRKSR